MDTVFYPAASNSGVEYESVEGRGGVSGESLIFIGWFARGSGDDSPAGSPGSPRLKCSRS